MTAKGSADEKKEDMKLLKSYFIDDKIFEEDQRVIYFKKTPIPVIGDRMIVHLICYFCQRDVRVMEFGWHLQN